MDMSCTGSAPRDKLPQTAPMLRDKLPQAASAERQTPPGSRCWETNSPRQRGAVRQTPPGAHRNTALSKREYPMGYAWTARHQRSARHAARDQAKQRAPSNHRRHSVITKSTQNNACRAPRGEHRMDSMSHKHPPYSTTKIRRSFKR